MSNWPGQQLDRTAPNAHYSCQSSANSIGPGVNSTVELAVDCKFKNHLKSVKCFRIGSQFQIHQKI